MHYEWFDVSLRLFIIYIYININASLNRWVIILMMLADNLILNLNSRKSLHQQPPENLFTKYIRKNLDALTPHQIIDPLASRLHTSSLFMSINPVTHCPPVFLGWRDHLHLRIAISFRWNCLDFQSEVSQICPDLWSLGRRDFRRNATDFSFYDDMQPLMKVGDATRRTVLQKSQKTASVLRSRVEVCFINISWEYIRILNVNLTRLCYFHKDMNLAIISTAAVCTGTAGAYNARRRIHTVAQMPN